MPRTYNIVYNYEVMVVEPFSHRPKKCYEKLVLIYIESTKQQIATFYSIFQILQKKKKKSIVGERK